jgi:glutaredoxin-related protein
LPKEGGEIVYKEIAISIIVIVAIFGLNYATQNYTNYTVSEMKEKLDNTRIELANENPKYDVAIEKATNTFDRWEELDDILALYIEHDEIEKVKTALTSMKSFIEMQDDSQAVDSIDRCKYILEHIVEKEKFSIDNIF